ncbi:desmethylxanthohumol 6'-O-methyltransferase-like [Fagus crenata]
MEPKEVQALLKGQAEIWQHLFGFVDSMALKCAVELRIADIIHSHGGPITLCQIASGIINSPSLDIPYLARIMRSLTLYGLTPASKWLLHDNEQSLVPMVIMENHPWQLAPWHCLSQCVKEGGIAFEKAHGCEMWDFASKNPEFNTIFNDAMACTAKIVMGVVLEEYKDGFDCLGSLVDIVKAHPHIKGINFDLPHVVATAPIREGVSHVGGNMFEAIPTADSIFMKWVLHDWSDEHCIKILRNCRKAISEKIGKVIIVDIVLEKDNNDIFDDTRMTFDLTELEWKKLLEEGGFPRYKITKIPTIPSIIEAYPI